MTGLDFTPVRPMPSSQTQLPSPGMDGQPPESSHQHSRERRFLNSDSGAQWFRVLPVFRHLASPVIAAAAEPPGSCIRNA